MSRETKRKTKTELDVSRFDPLVKEAMRAFSNDVAYAVQMARAAVTIERKRSVWRIRNEVRIAEKAARTECEKQNFVCPVDNPCGTGACRFAKGELAGIDIFALGSTVRPSNSIAESYSTESVVSYIHTQRLRNLGRPDSANEED